MVTNAAAASPSAVEPDATADGSAVEAARELSVEEVLAAFRRACPDTEVSDVRRHHQGYSGQHWVLETDEGALLLRDPRDRRGAAYLRHLVVATRRAAEAGVPTVRFRAFVPHDPTTGGALVVQEFAPGRSASDVLPELAPQQRAELGADLGRLVARLHGQDGGGFSDVLGRDAYDSAAAWALAELDRTLPIVAEVDLDWDDIARRVRVRLGALPPARSTLVHRDLYFDNVLVRDQDPTRVAAVLDFERARYDDPFADFGKLDELVFGWWPQTRYAFLRAYTEVYPIGPAEERRIHAHVGQYNIVMLAHFISGGQRHFIPDYVGRIETWVDADRTLG